jgi:hypothetical protein
MDGNDMFLAAAVVIFGIAAAAVIYAIKKFHKYPMRVVGIIGAIVGLLAAMPPVIDALATASGKPTPQATCSPCPPGVTGATKSPASAGPTVKAAPTPGATCSPCPADDAGVHR